MCNLVPCVVRLSKLNGSRVFDKQPVHPRLFFTEDLVDVTAAGHTLSFTQTHTHTLTHCHLLWGALWPPKHSPPPTPLSLTCSSAHPLCLHQTHINTVIGHPHVPVNLLMRRHGSCRVPLPPRCWPTCLRVSFTLAHANCLMDCLT